MHGKSDLQVVTTCSAVTVGLHFSTHLLYVTNESCFQIRRFTKNLQQVARFIGDLGAIEGIIFVGGRGLPCHPLPSFLWNVNSVQEPLPNSLRSPTPVHDTPRHNADGLSGRGLMTSSGYAQVIQ